MVISDIVVCGKIILLLYTIRCFYYFVHPVFFESQGCVNIDNTFQYYTTIQQQPTAFKIVTTLNQHMSKLNSQKVRIFECRTWEFEHISFI